MVQYEHQTIRVGDKPVTTLIDWPIREVTVYQGTARIIRAGNIDLNPGETTLELRDLPLTLDQESLRVRGAGAGITIRGVDVQRHTHEVDQDALQEELKGLEDRKAALSDEREVARGQVDYFKALRGNIGENTSDMMFNNADAFQRFRQIANFYKNNLTRLLTEIRDLNAQIAQLDVEIQVLQQSIKRPSQKATQTFSGVVGIEAETAVTFQGEIEYTLSGANWKSSYDIRLQEDETVELTYFASVVNQTQEDWEGVQIALSTARATRSSVLPKVRAWYVEIPQPQMEARESSRLLRRKSVSDATALPEMPDWLQGQADEASALFDMEVSPAPAASVQQATVEPSSGAAVTYRVATPVTIPHGNDPHKTTVTVAQLESTLDYLIAPRLQREAHLRATITNSSDYTLLPGKAAVFHEQEFVGNTQLVLIPPGDEFEVHLGVDDRVKVERELLKRDVGTRFIGLTGQSTFVYESQVTNLLADAIRVEVVDQYPIARSDRIHVKTETVSPPPTEENDLHILKWKMEIPAGETQAFRVGFMIEHERGQQLFGLDD